MQNRVVIVTGGFGILGCAVAAAFEEAGARVARIDFAPLPQNAKPWDIGGVDLADVAQAKVALDVVEDRLGAPSVLVNIAGGFVWQTLEDGGADAWARMFRMNALTAVTMCKVAVPRLLQSPSAAIINIGAGAAARADAGMGAYAAAKSAVARLTESLAAELAGQDIRINAVLPSIIDTPTNRADMPSADFTQWVTPQAIASVILFLASPAARAISGALIPTMNGSGSHQGYDCVEEAQARIVVA
ncbi:NADP-dependent 3-hydroxy acid dehydrogenase YdfG [Sphingobium sp. AP50]|nr:NADP-dependent 3-hydroxy acid dehydrogenase YdfG [Sphingobium sp. AP50]